MKITKGFLQQLIREELSLLSEADDDQELLDFAQKVKEENPAGLPPGSYKTAGELIAFLQKFPPKMPVGINSTGERDDRQFVSQYDEYFYSISSNDIEVEYPMTQYELGYIIDDYADEFMFELNDENTDKFIETYFVKVPFLTI